MFHFPIQNPLIWSVKEGREGEGSINGEHTSANLVPRPRLPAAKMMGKNREAIGLYKTTNMPTPFKMVGRVFI